MECRCVLMKTHPFQDNRYLGAFRDLAGAQTFLNYFQLSWTSQYFGCYDALAVGRGRQECLRKTEEL